MGTLATGQFDRVAAIAFARWGLSLNERKLDLVSTRLNRYLSRSTYGSVDAYLDRIETDATAGEPGN